MNTPRISENFAHTRTKVSVAMITYNHERFIAQAIESVLAQTTEFPVELVIGEDCSTDGTRAVIVEFQHRYPDRIKLLLRDRNVGPIPNLAETLDACHGEYVAFLEGDDYWTAADKLQKQVDFLDAHPDRSMCCSRARFLHEPHMQEGDVTCNVYPLCPAGAYTIENILAGNFVMTCTAVLRRRFVGHLPKWLFRMKLADWPICALTARHGSIELMDEVLATYRVHRGGVWTSMPRVTQLEESVRMLKELNEELHYRYAEVIAANITGCYLWCVSMLNTEGDRSRALELISEAQRYLRQINANSRYLAQVYSREALVSLDAHKFPRAARSLFFAFVSSPQNTAKGLANRLSASFSSRSNERKSPARLNIS
jgi:glycosyltransferase involved in cell wall biosynthesis